jgi:hypothetical protein
MGLGDLIGRALEIIGIDKAIGLVPLVLCRLRYGARFDGGYPGLAFLLMFGTGVTHDFWPGLAMAESLRSLIGSAAPFAFSWSRLAPAW